MPTTRRTARTARRPSSRRRRAPVWVTRSVEAGDDFLGRAPSRGGVVAVYGPGAPSGAQKCKEDFSDTAAHGFAQQLNQTTRKGAQRRRSQITRSGISAMAAPARTAATARPSHRGRWTPGPVNWRDPDEDTPAPRDGDCLEFATCSAACSRHFRLVRRSHMQLEKMDAFG